MGGLDLLATQYSVEIRLPAENRDPEPQSIAQDAHCRASTIRFTPPNGQLRPSAVLATGPQPH
jgi:hypothetical protein